MFAVFGKVFAISEGLMPEDPKLNAVFEFVTLEVGLIVGGTLSLLGVIGSAVALGRWHAVSFATLVPTEMLRLVIPSVTALTLGFQVIISSFFLSVLGLKIRRLGQVRP